MRAWRLERRAAYAPGADGCAAGAGATEEIEMMRTRGEIRRMPTRVAATAAAWLALAACAAPGSAAGRVAAGRAPRTAAAADATPPVTLTPTAADSIRRAVLADRSDTEKWLRSDPSSYLATVQRRDFGAERSLTVGSASDNDLVVAGLAAHHLRVTVAGDAFHVEALDAGATFRRDSVALREGLLPPSTIHVDRYAIRLSHQRFPALIVFDPRSPRFKDYKGLKWFPVDLTMRFEAPLVPNPAADTVIILSTRGNRRRALRVGWFDLRVKGTPVRLEATRLLEPGVGEHDVSLFFRDATTGHDTYPVGRYVDPQQQPDGRWLIDFNQAYNPACAISTHYNCPIPPRENVLPVAIRAGEMDSHYLH
jgi:uncharacterized protein (DUF1684 family)